MGWDGLDGSKYCNLEEFIESLVANNGFRGDGKGVQQKLQEFCASWENKVGELDQDGWPVAEAFAECK